MSSPIVTPSTTSRMIAGPLTTPFVPPSYCNSHVISCFSGDSGCFVERDVTCGSNGYASRASACFPSGRQMANLESGPALLYSPGIACPVGWKFMGGSFNTASTVTCCPSNLSNSDSPSCSIPISYESGSSIVHSCRGQSLVTTTIFESQTASTQSKYENVWARQIQLVLDDSVPYTTFTGSADLVSTTNGPVRTTTPLPIPAVSGKTGLSTGAIVGIVIGAIAFIFIIAAIFFIRRRKQKRVGNHATSNQHDEASMPELVVDGNYAFGSGQHHKQGSKAPSNTEMTMAHPTDVSRESTKLYTPIHESSHDEYIPYPITDMHSLDQRKSIQRSSTPAMHETSRAISPEAYTYDTPVVHEVSNPASPRMSPPYIYSEDASQQPEFLERATAWSPPMTSQSSSTAENDARLAELEYAKAALEERVARLKHLTQLEEEHTRMEAEIERLKNSR